MTTPEPDPQPGERPLDIPPAQDPGLPPPAVPAPAEPLAPAGPPTARRSLSRRAGVVLTTIVTVVGAVASVIGIIQVLTRDTTNFSHLQISAAAAPGTTTEWAVPEDVVADLPQGVGCGPDLQQWLSANAVELSRTLTIGLRNTATEGAMLALTDLHAVGDVAPSRGGLSVRLVCDPSGVPPQQIYYGRVEADQPEVVAQHVRLELGGAPNTAPTVPIAFNLAPGESGTLPVELFSRYPAAGALEMTVLSGSQEQAVVIEGSEFELPAMLFAGDMYLYTASDGLVCLQTEARTIVECTFEELATELATARR